MTDNCQELHEALRVIWPRATLILCIFHLLQQVWRWLHDKNHGVPKDDRPRILTMFKSVVYANNVEEMDENYDTLMADGVVEQNEKANKYLEDVFESRESWSKCFRKMLAIRGNHTNNYCESNFLVLKDTILQRVKEYNVNGLIDRLINDFNDHFKDKLLSIASGSFDGVYSSRFIGKEKIKNTGQGYNLPNSTVAEEHFRLVQHVGHNTFLVPTYTDHFIMYL